MICISYKFQKIMLSWRPMLLPFKKDKDRREGKGTSAWGAELIQFKDNMKNWINSSLSSRI